MIPTMKSCSSRSRGRSHAEVTAMNHSFLRRMALLAAIGFCCLAGCAEEEPETVRIGVALYQQDERAGNSGPKAQPEYCGWAGQPGGAE